MENSLVQVLHFSELTMEFGYCKATVSKTLTMIALHVVLLCVFAAAKDEGNKTQLDPLRVNPTEQ